MRREAYAAHAEHAVAVEYGQGADAKGERLANDVLQIIWDRRADFGLQKKWAALEPPPCLAVPRLAKPGPAAPRDYRLIIFRWWSSQ